MSRIPRVLVTTRHETRRGKSIQFIGGLHLTLLLDNAVAPIPVAVVEGMEAHLTNLLDGADGLLVTEGGDLGPEIRPPAPDEMGTRSELDLVKDRIEAKLMWEALERDLPVLGICRGMELINTTLGGELYDDLPAQVGTAVPHLSHDDYHGLRHPVSITPGSPLHETYQRTDLRVTSYHHQGISSLAPELSEMAVAPDGVIEAFHHPDRRFVWGLQFHPERQLHDDPHHALVHARFSAAATAHAGERA